MGVVSRMAVTRYLALAFMLVATATAQDDFWPPFQEEWRCLGEDDGKLYDWVDDSPAWVEETHHLITYVDNPEGQAAIDFDCPVIDPTDTATWCPQGIDYYPVPCNCHAYYRCFTQDNGEVRPCIYKCKPYDLVYDPNTKSCVNYDQAPPGTCFTTSTRPTEGTTAEPTPEPTPEPTTEPTPEPTPEPTTTTEEPTTTTEEPTTITTTMEPTTTTPGPAADCEYEGQKLPYPGDCHKYYRCFTNPDNSFYVEVFTCGDWAFGPNQGSCVWPDIDNDLCH